MPGSRAQAAARPRFEPCDGVSITARLEALAPRDRHEQLGERPLVPGRVHGVDLDRLRQELAGRAAEVLA